MEDDKEPEVEETEGPDVEEMSWDHYGLTVYKVDGDEYAVGTDEECDKAVAVAVENDLWAFHASFLAGHIARQHGLDRSALEKGLALVQEKLCEDAGPLIRAMIGDGLDHFVEDAVRADGRGHFLSPYDSEEHDSDDIAGLPKGLYAYRIN